MKIDTGLLDELLRKMREAGLSEIEVREGEQRVLLRLPSGAEPETVPVIARGMGILRLAHPCHKDGKARAGQKVVAGDTVAFLEAGMTLTPVLAPRDGVIAHIEDKEGNLIGFGETIMVIEAR